MNDFDRDNLHWYLNCSTRERQQWIEDMGSEHLAYMIRLLKTARAECECNIYDELESELTDLTQAQQLLKQFTLNS